MNTVDITQKMKDMKFGNVNENNILDYLNKNVSNKIQKTKYKYALMDYYENSEDGKRIAEYEVKSRRIKHNQYKSLIFGKNKFDNSVIQIDKNIRQIYLFNCIDGIYKWELTDVNKQKDEYYFCMNGNFARNDKAHSVCNIKTQYLTKI